MTVAENIWLGREPRKGKFVDFGKMQKDTQELLDRLDMPYKATQKMYELSIAGHQLVEIAKAISCNASVIIMDEPSSAIGDEEINVLFKQIFSLREQGVAILYITHKMDEIFRIADDITIIRDGQWIETGPASDYDPDKLVARMVGREITNVFPKDTTVPIGDVILEVKDLTQNKADGGRFRNINFQLRAGEILGFAGLVGAGRSEVMRAIFGLDPISSGSVYLNGQEVHIKNTRDAINHGIAMVNEDRRTYGLVLGRSIHHNVSLVNLQKYTKGLIDDKAISKDVEKMRELLQIKIANEDVEASTLSGGNQQKVVLAKWLVGDVKVMILDEPTRGIDVGAKSEIHKLMTNFARQGMGIIMISSELPEVLGMSDRVVVMQEGIVQGVSRPFGGNAGKHHETGYEGSRKTMSKQAGKKKFNFGQFYGKYGIALIFVVIFIAASLFVPGFLSTYNLKSILLAIACTTVNSASVQHSSSFSVTSTLPTVRKSPL